MADDFQYEISDSPVEALRAFRNKIKKRHSVYRQRIVGASLYLASLITRREAIRGDVDTYQKSQVTGPVLEVRNFSRILNAVLKDAYNILKSKGIDNEEIIYNLISEDIFLEKYKNNQKDPEFDQREFIESEINREFKEREEELKRTRDELYQKSEEVTTQSEKNKSLKTKKISLEEELGHYKVALKSLKKDVKKLQNRPAQPVTQSIINFEAEEQRKEAEKYRNQLKKQIEGEIKQHKEKIFKVWQKNVWWNLIWVILLTFSSLIVILFPDIIPNSTIDKMSIRTILGVLILLVDGLFLYLIKIRYWDENNKDKKFAKLPLPNNLRSKLDELKNE